MTTSPHHLKGAAVFGVFLCFAFAYLMSFGMRAVTAVIAPELARELMLDPQSLGNMQAWWIAGFGAMQFRLR